MIITFIKLQCLPHTWYLTTEMQLFWLSPIILYPLFYRPKLGLVLVGLFMTASFFTPAIQLWVNRSSVFLTVDDRLESLLFMMIYYWRKNKNLLFRNSEGLSDSPTNYVAPYNRALPYFIGILLGYDVSYNKRQISEVISISI